MSRHSTFLSGGHRTLGLWRIRLIAAPTMSFVESPEHERRSVSEYVELEAENECVTHAEKISSERVMGHEYDVWDVETDKNRWWVITNPTNLYLQSEFKSMDFALSFHIGLMHRVFAKQARSARTGDEERDRLRAAWRKWEQAGDPPWVCWRLV
jgi:hypothetical protein